MTDHRITKCTECKVYPDKIEKNDRFGDPMCKLECPVCCKRTPFFSIYGEYSYTDMKKRWHDVINKRSG